MPLTTDLLSEMSPVSLMEKYCQPRVSWLYCSIADRTVRYLVHIDIPVIYLIQL